MWCGYRVIAADGSSIRLPNSAEVIQEFGLFKPNGTSGKMPPIGRVSLLIDLCTSFICNAHIGHWDISEQAMVQEQLPEVVKVTRELNHDKLLFIYDRGYTSLAFMQQHQELASDFIFRVQSGVYKDLWERVDKGETDFDFNIINRTTTKAQAVRVIALLLPANTIEVLITSLIDRNIFSLNDLSKAYMLRWQIEECYKRLKVTEEIENFSGVKSNKSKTCQCLKRTCKYYSGFGNLSWGSYLKIISLV